jgi:hypothetical protein
MNRIVYLNNKGTRWITIVNGYKERREFETNKGNKVIRTILYWKQVGNYALVCISWKGKKIEVPIDKILYEGVK